MIKKTKRHNGYSKRELIEIIKEMDAGQNQKKIPTEKVNTGRGSHRSTFSSNVTNMDK